MHYRAHMLNVVQRKPAGVNRALSSIAAFCDWAQENGQIRENPASHIPQAAQVKAPPKALADQELNRLLRTVHQGGHKRDIAMVELMVGTGLRIGEVAALTVADIEMSDRKGLLIVRHGKGDKYRQVPMNKDVRQALQDYLSERPADGQALFLSQKGGGLTSNAIWKMIKGYGDRAGLADLTPHALRHTFGTRLIRKHGVDIVTAAALMGHANISTTAVYTKPSQEDLAAAVEKLSKS